MKAFISTHHLKIGFLFSVLAPAVLYFLLFPVVFVFSKSPQWIAEQFLCHFFCLFSLWIINFSLVDFSPLWSKNRPAKLPILKRIGLATICALGVCFFAGFVMDQSGDLLCYIKGENIKSIKGWVFMVVRIVMLNALFVLIKYFFDYDQDKRRMQSEMETLKRENILALHESLKYQLNPHFLFNSLHTLKSLVKQNPSQSLVFIDELASVYRYMLWHHEKDEVTIQDEIAFLKSYLHLLKLRFGESILTSVEIPDAFLLFKMPPNTLQILIENAVKHNILSQKRPLRITIYAAEGHLIVENNLQPKESENTSSQVGLSNINSRYRILKGKSIVIEKDAVSFRVLLPITALPVLPIDMLPMTEQS